MLLLKRKMLFPPSVLPSLPHAQFTPAGTCAPLSGAHCPKGQLAAFSATAVNARGSQHCPRCARAGRVWPAWHTPFLLTAKSVRWLGASKRRWPSSEALPLCIDRQAGFSHSYNFMFTITEISSDSTALKSSLSFGPELKEGSKKGMKDSS